MPDPRRGKPTMILNLKHATTAGIVAAAVLSFSSFGQIPGLVTPPPMPANLQAPEGNTAYLSGHAIGTQNYICLGTTAGFRWTFLSPTATLFLTFKWINGDAQQQIITHFLSPNPEENGMPRATWQGSLDTSVVWAKAIESSTDATFVASGAIPWLLLQSVGSQRGPLGGSTISKTTFIQRLNTSGGMAPASGCTQMTDVGKTALVPYAADYFFYRPSRVN